MKVNKTVSIFKDMGHYNNLITNKAQMIQKYVMKTFSINNLLTRLISGKSFSHIKLCHGFWEREVLIFSFLKNKINPTNEELEEAFNKVNNQSPTNWPYSMYKELRLFFSSKHIENCEVLVSAFGWERGYEIEGTPTIKIADIENRLNVNFDNKTLYDGLFWKNAIIDGSFIDFVNYIKTQKVLVVAPSYNHQFSDFAQLKSHFFIEVDGKKAAWQRNHTLQQIIEYINKHRQKNIICLIQAGGATSAWLAYKLAPIFPKSSFLCLGQALNICNINKLEGVNWFMVYRKQIIKTINQINEQYFKGKTPEYEKCRTKGYDDCLYNEFINTKLAKKSNQVDFIEQKKIDDELYQKILNKFSSLNHFANFGPISELLEQSLHKFLNLADNKSVITCKSGTDALLALVGLFQIKQNKKLTWVVSGFGFQSTFINTLSHSIVLDCNQQGMFSLFELKKIPLDSWDGIIVTNIFGLGDDMSKYIDYCRAHAKELIIDNAAALETQNRNHQYYPSEFISFHHTKPWGLGEGGVIIVNKEDEKEIKRIINITTSENENIRRVSMNSKMSDYSAALILQRLINYPNWSRLYNLQKRRINSLLNKLSIKTLCQLSSSVVGSIPCLFPSEITLNQLENPILKLEKYYKPLNQECHHANYIYSRIINVPCHPDVAKIDTLALKKLFSNLKNNVNEG